MKQKNLLRNYRVYSTFNMSLMLIKSVVKNKTDVISSSDSYSYKYQKTIQTSHKLHNINVFNQASKLPTLFQIAVVVIPEKLKFCSTYQFFSILNGVAQLDGKQRRLLFSFK